MTALSRLPGVGERTARRLAYHLVESGPQTSEALVSALRDLHERVRRCSVCGNLTEEDPCWLCTHGARDPSMVCVVSSVSDISAIERCGVYGGLYHVLHGLLRPLDGIGPERLNVATLVRRVGEGAIREVIVATSPSVEGEATAVYLRNLLEPLGVVVSRIASGLPVGGELEYADRATLGRALQARRPAG